MANIAELERSLEVYKTINQELSKQNTQFRVDLDEKRRTIKHLNRELQSLHEAFVRFKQSVTEVVASAATDFSQIQSIIGRNAGNFHKLIDTVIETDTSQRRSQVSLGAPMGASRGTVNKVNPMIRTPYGGFVQNLSISIPRLNESALRGTAEVEAEQEELENTATSLYADEEADDDELMDDEEVSEAEDDDVGPCIQTYRPVRTADLERSEDANVPEPEPQPGTSYESDLERVERVNGLQPIAEVTEASIRTTCSEDDDDDDDHEEQPRTHRRSARASLSLSPLPLPHQQFRKSQNGLANKENAPPLIFTSTPFVTHHQQQALQVKVVLERLTNFEEFSETNNIRISLPDEIVPEQQQQQPAPPPPHVSSTPVSMEMVTETDESDAPSVNTNPRKRKRAVIVKRRSTERPKRSKRPAKGSLAEPSVSKKLRRSK